MEINGVALRTVRYSDKTSILSAWTAETGRVSLAMSASGGAESRRRRALSMPMSLFSGSIDPRPGRDILNIRDMRPVLVAPNVTAHPVKAAVALFMADVLASTLRESGAADPAMWQFIVDTVSTLDAASPRLTAAIPMWFMLQLARLTGIAPDADTWRPGFVLHLAAGIYRPPSAPCPQGSVYADTHRCFLSPEASQLAAAMSRVHHPRQLTAPGMAAARTGAATDVALSYFSAHGIPLTTLNSPAVLHALLH